MNKWYDGVLFDLDGTLVDSMWMWRSIDIEYLGRFGIVLPEDLQSKIEGKSMTETAQYFKDHFQIPDSIEQMKADWNQMAWDKYSNEVPLKPGVPEFLEYLRENEIHAGIATSNSRELVTQVLKVHSMEDYFDTIVTGCDIEKGKPNPDIYLKAAKALSLNPEKCLVFEDIIPGILAGKNAGMKVCAIEDAYSVRSREEKKELADYYIESFLEVVGNESRIFANQ